MPLTLGDIYGTPKPLAIEIDPAKPPLNVEYWPKFITEEFEQKAGGAHDSNEGAKAVADLLAPILVSWDLEDVPCTRAAMKPLPTEFLAVVLGAVMEDARPNVATA